MAESTVDGVYFTGSYNMYTHLCEHFINLKTAVGSAKRLEFEFNKFTLDHFGPHHFKSIELVVTGDEGDVTMALLPFTILENKVVVHPENAQVHPAYLQLEKEIKPTLTLSRFDKLGLLLKFNRSAKSEVWMKLNIYGSVNRHAFVFSYSS
jgi:hypothetical protein